MENFLESWGEREKWVTFAICQTLPLGQSWLLLLPVIGKNTKFVKWRDNFGNGTMVGMDEVGRLFGDGLKLT